MAPCKIAPSPVRQKYWPDRSELRQGVHEGAFTKALVKKHTFPSYSIENRSMDHVAWPTRFEFGVSTRVTSPIVGESKQDVRPAVGLLAVGGCFSASRYRNNRKTNGFRQEQQCKSAA